MDNNWSNTVFSVLTTYDLGNSLFLAPGLFFQSSWDDSVNPNNELCGGFNLMYKF